MWLFYTIIVLLISAVFKVLEKTFSKNNPEKYVIFAYAIYSIFNIIVGIIVLNTSISIDIHKLLLVLPVSILSILGYYCAIQAYKNCSISVVSPILNSKTIWILFLSFIILNDKLSIIQIILILLIIILNVLFNNNKDKKSTRKGIIYAVIYLFVNGTSNFLNKIVMMNISNPYEATFYYGLTGIVMIILFYLLLRSLNKIGKEKLGNYTKITLIQLLDVAEMIALRYALIDGNVTIINAMTSCSLIFSVLLSRIFLKDKLDVKKWILIILMTISLCLLSIFSV